MDMEARIREKLTAALAPSHLEIRNNSLEHAGHSGSPNSGHSHFHLVITSTQFNGKNRVAQQRLVYKALAAELVDGLHALSIEVWHL
ncbi:MAG: BolA family transcriptional regulator [Alphaproteobacteria bacterium]|nr:BolA family transcriptional regulator [Alphaproteobacteria bacterium]